MKTLRKSAPRAGMSLVEVMVAVTILAFALLPLFMFMRTGARGARGTRDIATATFLASQALERVRAWPYRTLADEDLQATPGGGPPPPGPSGESVFNASPENEITIGRTKFTRTVEIERLAQNPGDPDVKLVKVSVTWKRKNTPLGFEVSSVITNEP